MDCAQQTGGTSEAHLLPTKAYDLLQWLAQFFVAASAQRKARLFAVKQIPVHFRSVRRPSPRKLYGFRNRGRIRERARELKQAAVEAESARRAATVTASADAASAAESVVLATPAKKRMGHIQFFNAAATELIAIEKAEGRWEEYIDESERLKKEDYPPDVQERLRPYLPWYLESVARDLFQKFGVRSVINYSYVDEEKGGVYASE